MVKATEYISFDGTCDELETLYKRGLEPITPDILPGLIRRLEVKKIHLLFQYSQADLSLWATQLIETLAGMHDGIIYRPCHYTEFPEPSLKTYDKIRDLAFLAVKNGADFEEAYLEASVRQNKYLFILLDTLCDLRHILNPAWFSPYLKDMISRPRSLKDIIETKLYALGAKDVIY